MEKMVQEILESKWRVGAMVLGILLVGWGIWQTVQQSQGSQVEVITEDKEEMTQPAASNVANKVVVIDIGGAVVKPGLYKFDEGIRIGEAIAAAGGLTDEANGDWVARTMNQAEVVRDGQKIYIPSISEADDGNLGSQTSKVTSNAVAGSTSININTATVEQLDSLWGIGEARAKQIIENRPYSSVEELKSQAGIPQNVLDANEGKWSVY